MGAIPIDLSIVIVNWNVKGLLERCLSSIYENTKNLNFEIFVIDNNSTDSSQAMIKEKFLSVNLIVNNENLGFSKACNQGAKLAKGKYILFLNPDCELTSGALDKMVEFMRLRPDVGVCGAKLISPDGEPFISWRHFISPFTEFMEYSGLKAIFPKSKFFNYFEMGGKILDESAEVDMISGACLMVEKALFDKIRFFDEKFFMYLEDFDLCQRIKNFRRKIFFYPDVKIVHHVAQSVRSVEPRQKIRSIIHQSRLNFLKKHFGASGLISFSIHCFLYLFMTFIFFPFLKIIVKKPRSLELVREDAIAYWQVFKNFFFHGK